MNLKTAVIHEEHEEAPRKTRLWPVTGGHPLGDSRAWRMPLKSFVFFVRFVDETSFSG
jgi:hypothetical protein